MQWARTFDLTLVSLFGNSLFSFLPKKFAENMLKYTCTLKKFEKTKKMRGKK